MKASFRIRAWIESLGVLLALIGLWWLASHQQWVSKVFLPTPEATVASLLEGLIQGDLLQFTLSTVVRMGLGWGLASVLGVALGALIGSSATARIWIGPTLEFVRPLPASALLPRLAFVFKVGLPNAMPDILAGMRLSLTVSLIVAVVGEMIASQSGLGQAILLAARSFRASELFAGVVLLGAIGFASNALLAVAEKKLLNWQTP